MDSHNGEWDGGWGMEDSNSGSSGSSGSGKLEKAKDSFPRFKGKPFRKNQEMAIERVMECKKKVLVLCAPCGSGKSLIGMTAGRALEDLLYMVHSKALQYQIKDDFSPHIQMMFGRENYKCLKNSKGDCSVCLHSRSHPCHLRHACLYDVQKKKVLQSNIRVLNYSYFLHEANHVGKFGGNQLTIIDEADSLEGILADYIGLSIPGRTMERLGIVHPRRKTNSAKDYSSIWSEWALDSKAKIVARMKALDGMLESMDSNTPVEVIVSTMKSMGRLKTILNSMDTFMEDMENGWIYEDKVGGKDGVSFKPVWISEKLAEKSLWGHSDRFVLMSATFPPLPVLGKLLGCKVSDMEYLEIPSTFSEDNRRVMVQGGHDLSYKTIDDSLPRVLDEISVILDRHKNEKGLIHTVSYKVNEAVMGIGDKRLITHNARDKMEKLTEFKKSSRPLVLVSPSSERGISLDDDLARFIIFVKAPFLNLKDKMVNARLYGNKFGAYWYASNMLLTVIQGCGRACRSDRDWCVTYCIDSQIKKAMLSHPSMMPEWFRDAVEFPVDLPVDSPVDDPF